MTTNPWSEAICFALIPPLITFQSANQSLYTMFLLPHGLTTGARDKQCVCSMRSNNILYVYTFLLELLFNFWILDLLLIEYSYKHGWNFCLPSFVYVSSSLVKCVTCCYNLIVSGFSGLELIRAPASRFSLCMNPGI